MKYFMIVFLMSLLGCEPLERETIAFAEQPTQVQAGPAKSIVQLRSEIARISKKPTSRFEGTYQRRRCPQCMRAKFEFISFRSFNEKTKTISFATILSGQRKEYTTKFRIIRSGAKSVLEVDTEWFRFSTDGVELSIDLFEGLHLADKMDKMKPFKYNKTNKAVLFEFSMGEGFEKPSHSLKNASVQLLRARDVENLQALDLEIMKNAIYARHGAFLGPRMNYFMSSNDWYVPIFTMQEAQVKLTQMEIKNINLIVRFEKHARRYIRSLAR